MAISSPTAEGWAADSARELPPGVGPYQLAAHRLRRNRTALAFGGVFAAEKRACRLALQSCSISLWSSA
jgi:hypothetical protein